MFVLFAKSRTNNYPNISFLCLRAPGQPAMVDGPSVSSILASNWLSPSHVGLSLVQTEHSAPARGSGPLRGSIAVLNWRKVPYSLKLLESILIISLSSHWIYESSSSRRCVSCLFPLVSSSYSVLGIGCKKFLSIQVSGTEGKKWLAFRRSSKDVNQR